uniref:CARD domain-containing protein n=1 Tax=Caenorhabditis tropicalis TaxID=1561998 RepID=A0A1I7US82_9PELO
MTQEVVEKIYEKIDKELGETHVEEIVRNLMATENEAEAMKNLMELHKQCCSVFLNFSPSSGGGSRVNSTRKKIVKK